MSNTFNNATVKLSSTSTTDIYQAPNTADADRAVVLSILVANIDGVASADITIIIADSSNTELSRLAHTIPVPADTSLEIVPNRIVLKRGQKIRAAASAANDLDVTVSAMEIA
jgi:hypothetical protein